MQTASDAPVMNRAGPGVHLQVVGAAHSTKPIGTQQRVHIEVACGQHGRQLQHPEKNDVNVVSNCMLRCGKTPCHRCPPSTLLQQTPCAGRATSLNTWRTWPVGSAGSTPGRCNAAAPAAADRAAGLKPRLAAMAYGFAAAPYAMPPCDRELLDPLPAQHEPSMSELRISGISTLNLPAPGDAAHRSAGQG